MTDVSTTKRITHKATWQTTHSCEALLIYIFHNKFCIQIADTRESLQHITKNIATNNHNTILPTTFITK
jgi:hypothetical protein